MERSQEYAEPELRGRLARLPTGSYLIEYTDNTHLEEGKWLPLLNVEVAGGSSSSREEPASPYYAVRPAVRASSPVAEPAGEAREASGEETGPAPEKARRKGKTEADKGAKAGLEAQDERYLLDQVGLALGRCGLLRPGFSREEAVDLLRLSQAQAVSLLPDTNALFNGTLHWLTRALGRTQLLVQPVSVSLAQVQQRDVALKAMVGKAKPGNLRQALRSRSFVNGTLGLLERLGQRYQVLEVSPELLRYLRTADKAGSDPDQGDVLEDRLLLEAIHAAWSGTRSRAERRVVTSDVMFARVLAAEGLTPLFLESPVLPEGPVPCVRFEPLSQRFEGAPLSLLLWELAHGFGTVRLRQGESEVARLSTYWPRKGFRDWAGERLQVTLPAPPGEPAKLARKLEQPPPKVSSKGHETDTRASHSATVDIDFPTLLRIAGKFLLKPLTPDELLEKLEPSLRPEAETLHRGIELLVQISLAKITQGHIRATDSLISLNDLLESQSLEYTNGILTLIWRDYSKYMRLLESSEAIQRRASEPAERLVLNQPPPIPYEHFVYIPVYLGQAYTHNEMIRYGGSAFSADRTRETLQEVFDLHAQDDLLTISALLQGMCEPLGASPWRLRKHLATEIERGSFPEYVFQPSAAREPTASVDSVLAGSLNRLKLEPVPLDHLLVKGRPVFTVRRRARK